MKETPHAYDIHDRTGAGRFLWPALAFFIPFAIHAIAFASINVSPFGERTKSMMVIDNFHQYSPFLIEFREILKNGGSLLYSWNDGLGSNYWARYAYYLASPLNLLFVFFPARTLPEFIVFLSLFRTGFSGFTFYTYARGKFGGHNAANVAFAAMYAISAHTLAYYWNIMWFDCIALLPLIMLGLERLVRGRRGVMHCVTLAVAMYSNYYFALIICIFAFVYFLVYSAVGAGRKTSFFTFIRNTGRFAGYSLLAAGLAAVILLPTWYALAVSQSAGAKFPSKMEFYYNALEILSGHLFNITPSVMSGKPNLYCGTAALIMIPLYFLNRKFSIREKAVYGVLLVFMMLSCNINYLNFIWHGLHFPNSLPYRFTFLYIFVVAALSLKAYVNIDGVSRRTAFLSCASASAYVLILEKLAPEIASPGVLYPSLALLLLYAAIIAWASHSARPESYQPETTQPESGFPHPARSNLPADVNAYGGRLTLSIATIALLLLTTAELSVNAGLGIGAAGVGQRNNYMEGFDEIKTAVTAVNALETGPFSRVEFLKDTVSNTPSLYGYRGASYFSSTAVLKVTDLMGRLGFRPSSAWYIYKGSTPVINSMLSLRYLMSKEDTYDNPIYPFAGEVGGVRYYENPYALPLGFFAERDVLSLSVKQPDVFKLQNEFLKRSAGSGVVIRDVMRPVDIERKELKNTEITSKSGNLYHYKVLNTAEPGFLNFSIKPVPGAGGDNPSKTDVRQRPLYLYIESRQLDYVWYIKGNRSEGYDVKNYPFIIDMQYFGDAEEFIEISLKIENFASGSFEMYASYFDEDAFVEAYNILNSRPLVIDSFSDTKISGTVSTDKPGVLFTTIPYDRGWTVRLDGAALPPEWVETVGEGFIAVTVGAGTHSVEFSYMPEGFLIGLIASLFSAAMLCFIFITTYPLHPDALRYGMRDGIITGIGNNNVTSINSIGRDNYMSNPVLAAIADRRSNRAYKNEPITQGQLDAILAAAEQAPSARNAQPWHFTVVRDAALLNEINAEISANLNEDVGDVFYAAPTVIFIAANVKGPTPKWARLDCGIAVQTIALAAHSLGLGSVILGMPDAAFTGSKGDYFNKLFKFPDTYEFAVAIAIGAALDTKAAHPILPNKISFVD